MLDLKEYLLGQVLHTGAETQVLRAIHQPSGARVVVKLPVAETPTARVTGRLIHEHEMLVKLAEVPGVARVRALKQRGALPALVLEDAGLRSLEQVLAERGRLPWDAAVRVALSLSRVLEGVHAAGVMHKDINPHNVLVDEAFTHVVLLDFAIASWLSQEATTADNPEALEGTLAYMSPEQTGRTARALDSRTDLYSLGVMLFEMISGWRPFLEKDALALVHAHLAKPPPALGSLVADVPGVVSQIVARCLEKHPENRYQTAKGLSADLSQCLQQLEERGSVDSFPLGQRDFSPTPQIPQTLVSRETESREIMAAFERACGGAVEVLLLAGPSGAGKTALVGSAYREIAKTGRGLLLSGKYDQLGGSVPYAGLGQAFGGLLRNLAASPKPVLDDWRARIDRALGPLARVIADVVPELEWLMGPIDLLSVVPAEMTYNRIKLSWIELVRAVTDVSPPLVLFLDDIQWVDPASLELLKTVLTDVSRKHLLVIAAYRDNEMESTHPFWALIEAVAASGVETPRLTVGPLGEASVQIWLAMALSTEPARVGSLAKALWSKTYGNPFFLGQLLLELHRQKCVRRTLDDGVWQWDQDAVERVAVTDNVVELMQRKVVELPAATQALLGQAACAGHGFSLAELSVLTGLGQTQLVQDLRPALLTGLVTLQDEKYAEAQALVQAAQGTEMDAGYQFLHNRVQQAFYERIAPEQRTRTHLLIGRRLQTVFEQEGGSNQKLLELARHLNVGAAALSTEAERKDLARLNLRAASAAKANGSYHLQATLVDQAQALLGPHAWTDEPRLSVELALERMEADFMLKQFDDVHRRAQELLALPLPALPRLAAQELRVRTCVASGRYGEGERLGIAALAEQGLTYPESNMECIALALQAIGECDAWFDEHPDGFRFMPADPSLEHTLCDALEAAMVACAGIGSRPGLMAFAAIRNVKQVTKRQSMTPISPFFIACFSGGRSAFLGDYRGSVRWAREGGQAAKRLSSPFLPECCVVAETHLIHVLPVERSREPFRAVARAATASGSFQGTSWGLASELYYADLWAGRPLSRVAEREQTQREVMARGGDAVGAHFFALAASYAGALRTPKNPWPGPDEDWLTASSRCFLAAGRGVAAELARIQEAHLFLAFGHYRRALDRANEAERFRPAVYAHPPVTDIPLWRGLAAAKCYSPTLAPAERTELVATLEHALERFRYFSEGCAENFLHKLHLLEAEHARIHGHTEEAMAKYDEAITLARREGFLHIEGLAAQLCAEYRLQAGRERVGTLYLQEARDAYFRWGAVALVAHLETKYPDLLKASIVATAARRTTIPPPRGSEPTAAVAFDIHTAIRAAQALSSELDPKRVVGRLMELCLTNAGAQRGVLVLAEDEALAVAARLSVEDARIETGLSTPLEQSSDLATTVVQYVARSREPVVVNDVSNEKRFGDDPYLAARPVRSLLALPLTHRGRVAGVLYLEHRDAPSAFPPSRVELLSVLASQAAIAVENANLYRNAEAQVRALEARNQEIQQLNDELRRQIAQRSQQLMDALLGSPVPSPARNALTEGSLLGDCYRIIGPIGEGGMGAVYEVERTTDGVHLAAKVLHSRPDRIDMGRFAREAQILAKLSHPNLISIADIDVTPEGMLYIVMELVSGASLRQFDARQGDVPWILCVLRQVAEALGVLHAQSIVHRDLKPENILIVQAAPGALPMVKLVDFGISIVVDEARRNAFLATVLSQPNLGALQPNLGPGHTVLMTQSLSAGAPLEPATIQRSIPRIEPLAPANASLADTSPADASAAGQRRREPLLTQTGALIGTPYYMAPELGRGSQSAEPPADIFSLGVIAFELFVGQMPFPCLPILFDGSAEEISPALRQCPGLHPELAELFERCLHLDPAKRPVATEIAERLERTAVRPKTSSWQPTGSA